MAEAEPAYFHFDGRAGGSGLFLNKLEVMPIPGSCCQALVSAASELKEGCMPEVGRQELIWRVGGLRRALFTSYGTDYKYARA